MRVIGDKVINAIKINDPIGGGDVELFYRTPTTEERQRYNSALFQAQGRKVKVTIAQARQKFGAQILVGIREGDFSHAEGDAPAKPLSSDPASVNYRQDWKNLVGKYASDLIEAVAQHVFEGARIQQDVPDQDDEQADHDAEVISEKN